MPTDEKDTNAGQRGTIKNKFQKRSYAYHQYHDPTYMSFFIMIDWHHSKLFNGIAVEFLKETLGDPLRAAKLERFTKNFQKLVMEMPWCFQEMEGLDNAFKGFDLKKNFRGGWEDRDGNYVKDEPSTNEMASLSVYFDNPPVPRTIYSRIQAGNRRAL